MEIYPVGQYRAAVVDAVLAETATGKEYVAVRFRFAGGPLDGKEITAEKYLTDRAWEYSLKDLRTCGWAGDNVNDLSSMTGTEVMVTIKHEDVTDREGRPKFGNDGKPAKRARVQWINPIRVKAMEADKATSFAERMRARVREFDAKNPPPANGDEPAPAPAPAAARTPPASLGATGTDDDLPF